MPKVHYARKNVVVDGETRVLTLCGKTLRTATRDIHEVTCKQCESLWAVLGGSIEEYHEETPWTPPPPRPVKRGAHEMSEEDAQAIEDSVRGYRERASFTSLGAALTSLVQLQVDGHSAPSVSGTYESLGAMGTLIQTSGRSDAASTRNAERAAEVERAIRYALRNWTNEALSRSDARALLLAMEVGMPFDHDTKRRSGIREWSRSERGWVPLKAKEIADHVGHLNEVQVGKLKARIRRLVIVEMAARGLLPLPARPRRTNDEVRDDRATARYVQTWQAIETRRGELEQRRAA